MRIPHVRRWPIRFHWVLVPGIIFLPLALGGFIAFRNANLPNLGPQRIQAAAGFAPRTIQPQTTVPRTITPQTITPQQLTPARNLVGSFRGNAKYIFHQTDQSFCYYNFQVDLAITNQNGNALSGNVSVSFIDSESHSNFACQNPPNEQANINGTIAGSSLTINTTNGDLGNFSGSLTTDTITLNQPLDKDGDGVVGPINLLRQ